MIRLAHCIYDCDIDSVRAAWFDRSSHKHSIYISEADKLKVTFGIRVLQSPLSISMGRHSQELRV